MGFIWNEGQVYVLVLLMRDGVALCFGGTSVSNGPIVGPLDDMNKYGGTVEW